MTETILLLVVAATLIGVLGLIIYANRRAGAAQGSGSEAGGLSDGLLATDHSHSSHSHVDCSAHSVDCGGHGGH